MDLTHWEVARRGSYADGRSFGDYGAFEIVEGRVHYRVDPLDARNAGIVDLDLAPKDERGFVVFSGDYTLVAPCQRVPRKLLIDVPNRGRRLAFSMFNRATPQALLDDPCAAGDGFLFRHGFAVASIGWQWDVQGVALDAPPALQSGRAIEGDVACRIQPSSNRSFVSFGQLGEVTYPPARRDDPAARLFVRDHDNAPQVELAREQWRFARERGGALEPSDRFIHCDGGFEKGRIYTLVYRARGARVTGCGLLALRDAAASLRAGNGPNAAPFERVVGFGASQTGRVLRHLLHLGLNSDADGGVVFDGLHIHIAGGQRGDFNHRFAQPSSAGLPAAGQRFPFAGTTSRDPATGVEDGLYRLLGRSVEDSQHKPGHMPKVILTNTSWEYWRGDAALTHVSADGRRDLEARPCERNYLFAGTHHLGGILAAPNTSSSASSPSAPVSSSTSPTGERARYAFNVVDFSPLTRAAFMNLDRWLDGQTPPPSAVPTLAAGTLASRASVLRRFAAVGFEVLDADRLGGLSALDLGAKVDQGICRFPAREVEPYARLVSAVDDTLNEVAGIRLPDIAVAVGCHTGWNPRHPDSGAPTLAATFVGFTCFDSALPPFDEYQRRVRAWAAALADNRFVLPEDVDRVIDNCLTRYRVAERRTAGVDRR